MPFAATAAISAFSVAVTLGSSRKTSAPRSSARAELIALAQLVRRAPSCSKHEKVRVEPAPTDDVAARRRAA